MHLNKIEATYANLHEERSRCMTAMLTFWVEYKPGGSWNHICAALKEMHKDSLSSELEAKYLGVRMLKVAKSSATSGM